MIAVPLGIYIGVTGKGVFMIAGLANALRALPSVGLLILLVLLISPAFPSKMGYILPSLIVLVLLAVPPILTNTYAGIRAVDAAAVDAAKGMGFRTDEDPHGCSAPLLAPADAVRRPQRPAADHLDGDHRGLHFARWPRPPADRWQGPERLQPDGRRRGAVALLALFFDQLLAFITRRVVSPGLTRLTVKPAAAADTVKIPATV